MKGMVAIDLQIDATSREGLRRSRLRRIRGRYTHAGCFVKKLGNSAVNRRYAIEVEHRSTSDDKTLAAPMKIQSHNRLHHDLAHHRP